MHLDKNAAAVLTYFKITSTCGYEAKELRQRKRFVFKSVFLLPLELLLYTLIRMNAFRVRVTKFNVIGFKGAKDDVY